MLLVLCTESGVTTDVQTSDAAKIMGISILPFLVVQIPKVFPKADQRLSILFALTLAILLVLGYCLYQVLPFFIFFYCIIFNYLFFFCANKILLLC
jgi:hypothetical protein